MFYAQLGNIRDSCQCSMAVYYSSSGSFKREDANSEYLLATQALGRLHITNQPLSITNTQALITNNSQLSHENSTPLLGRCCA
jgi:hypothetical protein